MAGNVEKIRLGAALISYNGETLGLTKGGVEVTISTTSYKVNVDQYGGTEINEFITSRSITIKVPLAESTLYNLAVAMPGTTLVTGTNKAKLVGNVATGLSLLQNSKRLVLHPKDLAITDLSEDLIVPLASCKGDLTFAYKHDEERVYTAEFTGYANTATGVLFVVGDDGATTTNPPTTTTPSVFGGVWSDTAFWNDIDNWKDI